MDEKELVFRLQRGDEAAFEAFIKAYEKKIYALCFRLCGNAQDAEEAAQDAFLSVWRSVGSFRQDSALSTWLYRLAANACLDLLRRSKKTERGVSPDDEDAFIEIADSAPLPQEALERRETQRAIRRGLAALPEEYRAILLLREAEGLSYQEISETLSLELGTVKSRLSRARGMLRSYLTADGNFFAPDASKRTECNGKESAHEAL